MESKIKELIGLLDAYNGKPVYIMCTGAIDSCHTFNNFKSWIEDNYIIINDENTKEFFFVEIDKVRKFRKCWSGGLDIIYHGIDISMLEKV